MYEAFYQLEARPFLASPLAERYFPAASIEHARETVIRCIERAEGPAVVLGPAGTGKSTLCQVLAEQMRVQFHIVVLASARLCTRRALLQNILFELKLPYRDREEGELRLALMNFLEPDEECPHGILLLVDEAHMLPLRLLEELRMITNLVRGGQPRVRLVLAASLLLDERLAAPRLESFNQRIAARCYLQSMNHEDTSKYIRAQIATVGGQIEQVFTEEALRAVYRATDGIPRLVNQVCDHVLMMGAIGRQAPVDAAGVEEAWADLQQLPTPWMSDGPSSPSTTDGSILEFGELDDATTGELGTADAAGELDVAPRDERVAADASERLDEIETGLSAIVRDDALASSTSLSDDAGDDAASQFRPAAKREPEIELVFHHAHNPFNERFEEEEVIVDPYASLEALHGPIVDAGPRATSKESTIRFPADAQSTTDERQDALPVFCDPVLPEYMEDVQLGHVPVLLGAGDSLPGDDRDLLEIHDDVTVASESHAAATVAGKARRREYRQLFASLRRR